MFKEDEELQRKIPDRVILTRLSGYLFPFKRSLAIIALMVLVSSAADLLGPYLLRTAIDTYITKKDVQGLFRIAIAGIVLSATWWFCYRVQRIRMNTVGQTIIYRLREDLFSKIQSLSLGFFAKQDTGDTISKMTNDVNSLNELLSSGLMIILTDVIMIGGILIAMFSLNLELATISMIVFPLVGILIWAFQKKARPAYLRTRRKIAGVTSRLQESISGMRVIQSFTRENRSMEDFGQANVENLQANLQTARIVATFMPLIEIVGAIGTCIVLWYGGLQVMRGELTIGVIVAFLQYINMIFRPLFTLAMFFNSYEGAMAASERIFELLDTPIDIPETEEGTKLPEIEGMVEFKNVGFGYDPEIPVLYNINLTVPPKQTIAIVGPTGAGKSTLINLLGRFYDPDEGTVNIDGYNLREVSPRSLHSQMGIVLQDPFLFSDTVMENIRYGRLEATDEEITEAAKAVDAHNFITRLPEGYNTEVLEGGSNLSMGQKQLISFARALLADPKILVLDEATSSVDPYTELLIKEALERLLRDRTSFVIAHRLSTVRNADRIVVLDKGRIIEEGTHSELVDKSGLYSQLYIAQFKTAPIVETEK
jgi:ATP-binding cassette subfamily B protein